MGQRPELFDRVSRNSTKYINKLVIDAVPGYSGRNGAWFDNTTLHFGHELTVIIGNKGSGKSAITDILGLCGGSRQSSHFSFLRKERFLEKGYAENFQARLEWVAPEYSISKCLVEAVESTSPELAKYLPQGYFEEVCNEISNLVEFRKEINGVVFQHIPEEDRLEKASFDEFLKYKRRSIDRTVAAKKQSLHELNQKIADLEIKSNPKYRDELEKKREKKQSELDALVKPKKVAAPAKAKNRKDSPNPISNELRTLSTEISAIKRQISPTRTRLTRHNNQLEALSQFKRELFKKREEIDEFVKEYVTRLRGIREVNPKKIVSYEFDFSPIDGAIARLRTKIATDSTSLKNTSVKDKSGKELSKVFRLGIIEQRHADLQAKLDEPNKKHQQYLKASKAWNEDRKQIIGTAKVPETLKYLDAQLDYLDNALVSYIKKKRKQRLKLVETIYQDKWEIVDIYDQVKRHIDNVIDENRDKFERYHINIEAGFVLSTNTIQSMLSFIHKNVMGTYRGAGDAEKRLSQIVDELDPNQFESISALTERIILSLERDERTSDFEMRFIDDQVQDVVSFYDYIFSLDYLQEHYELKLGEKSLEKLSPGEKGALLIVFYLLLDKSDKPLILDQPEDNLDNESVSRILVPFIKEARKRRQIIMVTHNPNLAVYADAEQIIRVEILKDQDNQFKHYSGGIESDEIKGHIVDVLEGTMPAFDNRSDKYRM